MSRLRVTLIVVVAVIAAFAVGRALSVDTSPDVPAPIVLETADTTVPVTPVTPPPTDPSIVPPPTVAPDDDDDDHDDDDDDDDVDDD